MSSAIIDHFLQRSGALPKERVDKLDSLLSRFERTTHFRGLDGSSQTT
jgi:hypothetical protein